MLAWILNEHAVSNQSRNDCNVPQITTPEPFWITQDSPQPFEPTASNPCRRPSVQSSNLVNRGANTQADTRRLSALPDVVRKQFLPRRAAGQEDEARRIVANKPCAPVNHFGIALEAEWRREVSKAREAESLSQPCGGVRRGANQSDRFIDGDR